MIKKAFISCLALFLSFTVLTVALGQVPTGEIKGMVKDSAGSVLPEVTVTATSPSLIGGPYKAITDEMGGFRLVALNTGIYELKFEMLGFKTLIRQGIKVSLNTTTTINVTMEIAPLSETIVASGKSAVVDAKRTDSGFNFNKKLLARIPNARDVWVLPEEAPGMVVDKFNVRRSERSQQSRFSAGTSEMPKRYNLDSIDITDMTAAGATTHFACKSFKELQVSTVAHKPVVDSPLFQQEKLATSNCGIQNWMGLPNFGYEQQKYISSMSSPESLAEDYLKQLAEDLEKHKLRREVYGYTGIVGGGLLVGLGVMAFWADVEPTGITFIIMLGGLACGTGIVQKVSVGHAERELNKVLSISEPAQRESAAQQALASLATKGLVGRILTSALSATSCVLFLISKEREYTDGFREKRTMSQYIFGALFAAGTVYSIAKKSPEEKAYHNYLKEKRQRKEIGLLIGTGPYGGVRFSLALSF
ncbi:hypothetical protein CEE39_09665 [bacterium (candidate division B38) B3_B38]|nr:MAG: hypothetical protein CEE39_09665 [bacterium (candidate division B38) B3_B38]